MSDRFEQYMDGLLVSAAKLGVVPLVERLLTTAEHFGVPTLALNTALTSATVGGHNTVARMIFSKLIEEKITCKNPILYAVSLANVELVGLFASHATNDLLLKALSYNDNSPWGHMGHERKQIENIVVGQLKERNMYCG